MAKSKRSRKKKSPTRVTVNPLNILNRLTVPEDRIKRLKQHAEADLLRLYLRSGTDAAVNSLYTTISLGRAMLPYVEESEEATEVFIRAEECLLAYDSTSEVIDLDVVREALELCCAIWRLVSVDEFVKTAKALRGIAKKE